MSADGRAASNSDGRVGEEETAASGEMEGFDPMGEAYFSSMNQYRDGEDVPAEYCDEVIDKEREICRYYRETRFCIRGKTCPMLHLYTGRNSGMRAIDKVSFSRRFHEQ